MITQDDEEPGVVQSETSGEGSIFVDSAGPEDTTLRPLRFKLPKPELRNGAVSPTGDSAKDAH